MDKPELKPCPFCGGKAVLYGQEIRDCVNGERAKLLRKEYWVKTHCDITCIYAMTAGRAFGIYDGIHYRTPEAAAEAWNRRADSKISVGDTVYQTDGVRVYEKTVRHVFYDTESVTFDADAIGSSIFLTRKEAEERMEHYGKP